MKEGRKVGSKPRKEGRIGRTSTKEGRKEGKGG